MYKLGRNIGKKVYLPSVAMVGRVKFLSVAKR